MQSIAGSTNSVNWGSRIASARILLIGRIIAGQPTEWRIAPLPADEGSMPVKDDEALAIEWEDYRLEQEWLDHWL